MLFTATYFRYIQHSLYRHTYTYTHYYMYSKKVKWLKYIVIKKLNYNTIHCWNFTQYMFRTFHDQRDIYVPLTKSLFKSAGITVSHFFSMLPSTLNYLCSVEPVRMHFPAKQPCTNDTVCNAACSIAHSIIYVQPILICIQSENYSVKEETCC